MVLAVRSLHHTVAGFWGFLVLGKCVAVSPGGPGKAAMDYPGQSAGACPLYLLAGD
mgnify:CR=1 FL=1